MFRRMWPVVLAVMLLPLLGLRTMAAEETGSIRVTMQRGETTIGGAVTLYRVGEPISEGYRLAADFGGGIVWQEDAQSPYLAQWLAETAGEQGLSRRLEEGTAEFTRLEQGLYLLVQTETEAGYLAVKPFLIELPCQGQWNVQACPKTQAALPATGQSIMPFLGGIGMVLSSIGLALCAGRRRKK
ncbi:MAG: LPXTG cell wall anchor domain-containing protein [Faecousia sp.]